MQPEALRYKKSFDPSPKPSTHLKYTVSNDSNVEKYKKNKNVEKLILTGARICKKKTLISMVKSVLAETF